jgi:phosphate starvation-inducible PhoH-like protein
MGKRKRLANISEEDLDFINAKMKAPELSDNYEYVDGYKNQLKLLSYKLNIKCKNEKQKEFLKSLKDKNKEICFGTGSAGTGKSFMSLSYGLKAIKDGEFDKIIMVVPTAQASGKDMGFGFLKGELEDKTRPFKDVDRYTIEKILKMSENNEAKLISSQLINSGVIQYEFINFMLGKTFDNALILVNEAEQYTKEDMKLILTRIGEKSKLVITGDCEQVNRQSIVKGKDECGLSYVADKLDGMEEVAVTTFSREDIVRNKLITKILDRLDS